MSHKWVRNQIVLVETPLVKAMVVSIHGDNIKHEKREVSRFISVVSNLHLDVKSSGYSDGSIFATCICSKHDALYLQGKFGLPAPTLLAEYNRILSTAEGEIRTDNIMYPAEHITSGFHSVLMLQHGKV